MKLLGTEKAPLFEKKVHLWADPGEDYHDFLLLVRGDVVDKKAVKTAIKATFTNRGTSLQKLPIPKDQVENIQRYWGIYFKATDPVVQRDLATDIQAVMIEINHYFDEHDLIGDN